NNDLAQAQNLSGMDFDVGRLRPLDATARLVEHDRAMRQRVTLTLTAASEDQRGRAGGHPGAERADRRMDVAHRVVDGQSRRQRAARAVDVDADLLVGILAVEEEQL